MSLVALLAIIFVTCLVLYAINRLVPAPTPTNTFPLRAVLTALVVVLASLYALNGIGVFHGAMRLC